MELLRENGDDGRDFVNNAPLFGKLLAYLIREDSLSQFSGFPQLT